MDGVVFAEEDVIWLKAEAWKSEYEDVELPKPLNQYKLYTEVTKAHKDGSYRIYFTVDEVSMDVFPIFFEGAYLTEKEASEREELDGVMVSKGRKAYYANVNSSSDEEGNTSTLLVAASAKKAPPPRGRAKKSPRKESLDTSDCEEEAEDQGELDAALEDEDVEEVDDDSVTFGALDEEVDVESMPFDATPNRGNVKSLSRFDGYSPFRIFVELFIKIIECVVRCTNAQLGEGVTPTNTGEIMVFISIYLQCVMESLTPKIVKIMHGVLLDVALWTS